MRSYRILKMAVAVFLVISLPAVGLSQDLARGKVDVDERLRQIEDRLSRLEKRIDEALNPVAAGASLPATAPEAGLAGRFDALDQKIRIMQRKRELEQDVARAQVLESPVIKAGRDGFQLRSPDGYYQLRFKGNIQSDARFFAADSAGLNVDTFLLRTARPIVEGSIGKYFDFRIMPDFGQGQTILQDLYLELNLGPKAKVRAGKFKSPFGLERLQSETDTLFVERGLPTLLVPNRDMGVQLYGDLWGGTLSYAAGVFNGVIDGGSSDTDDNKGKDFAGRIFTHPFKLTRYPLLQNLGLGLSGTVGDRSGNLTSPGVSSYKTSGQATFFRYRSDGTLPGTVTRVGTQYRISPQAYYYAGPFGLLTEYVLSSQEVRKGANAAALKNRAWQAAGSYVLTGEKASFKGVIPKSAREGGSAGWGAWEIAGRFSQLNIDDAAYPLFANPQAAAGRAREWAIGLNWYINRNVKFVLDYDRSSFKNGAIVGNRQTENGILTRLQFAY